MGKILIYKHGKNKGRILNISRNTVKRYKRRTTYVETVGKWDKRGV